jgi:hypothetical protein
MEYDAMTINSSWRVANISERFYDNAAFPNFSNWQFGLTFPADFIPSPQRNGKDYYYSNQPTTWQTSDLFQFSMSLLNSSIDSDAWLRFQAFHFGGVTLEPLSQARKQQLLCSTVTVNMSAFDDCLKKTKSL